MVDLMALPSATRFGAVWMRASGLRRRSSQSAKGGVMHRGRAGDGRFGLAPFAKVQGLPSLMGVKGLLVHGHPDPADDVHNRSRFRTGNSHKLSDGYKWAGIGVRNS